MTFGGGIPVTFKWVISRGVARLLVLSLAVKQQGAAELFLWWISWQQRTRPTDADCPASVPPKPDLFFTLLFLHLTSCLHLASTSLLAISQSPTPATAFPFFLYLYNWFAFAFPAYSCFLSKGDSFILPVTVSVTFLHDLGSLRLWEGWDISVVSHLCSQQQLRRATDPKLCTSLQLLKPQDRLLLIHACPTPLTFLLQA